MQCIVVKSGQRCQNDSATAYYGLQVPLVKPEALAWFCGDCIGDMYQAMVARDFPVPNKSPQQIRQEFS